MRKFFLFKKYRCQKTSHSRNELCDSFSLSKTRQARGGARDRAGLGALFRGAQNLPVIAQPVPTDLAAGLPAGKFAGAVGDTESRLH